MSACKDLHGRDPWRVGPDDVIAPGLRSAKLILALYPRAELRLHLSPASPPILAPPAAAVGDKAAGAVANLSLSPLLRPNMLGGARAIVVARV